MAKYWLAGAVTLGLLAASCGGDDVSLTVPRTDPPPSDATPSPSPSPATPTPVPPTATRTPAPVAPPPADGGSPTPTEAPGTITNAVTLRNRLLDTGAFAVKWDVALEDGGFIEVARSRFPGLAFAGSAVGQADTVSFYFSNLNPMEPASDGNPLVFAFALTGSAGECAGGAISGYPLPLTPEKVDIPDGAKCTAQSVVDEMKKRRT